MERVSRGGAGRGQKCLYYDMCRREGHASAVCLYSCESKFSRCEYRPDIQEAGIMRLLEAEIDRMMRMALDALIEARLTRYAAEAESPELVAQIRECMRRIAELTE